MKIGFIGCGAIGSCYASYLISKHEVCVLDTYAPVIEAIKKNGILVDKNAPGHGNGATSSSCSSTISIWKRPSATPRRCLTITP